MMGWFAPLDLCCERPGPGLWLELLNAWSNLAFPLAALVFRTLDLHLCAALPHGTHFCGIC